MLIKDKLLDKNYISKFRKKELESVSMQYSEWYRAWRNTKGNPDVGMDDLNLALEMEEKMRMVERCAYKSDTDLKEFVFESVTKGVDYDYLKTNKNMSCSKNRFYKAIHRYYILLNRHWGAYNRHQNDK